MLCFALKNNCPLNATPDWTLKQEKDIRVNPNEPCGLVKGLMPGHNVIGKAGRGTWERPVLPSQLTVPEIYNYFQIKVNEMVLLVVDLTFDL